MNACEFVTFKGGLTVPVDAWVYLIDLEQRGVVLQPASDGSGGIDAQPRAKLTDDDRHKIKAWRWHLLALLSYEAPETIQ